MARDGISTRYIATESTAKAAIFSSAADPSLYVLFNCIKCSAEVKHKLSGSCFLNEFLQKCSSKSVQAKVFKLQLHILVHSSSVLGGVAHKTANLPTLGWGIPGDLGEWSLRVEFREGRDFK